MQIVFIGGDARMRVAAELLAKEGHEVRVCGLSASLPSIDKDAIFPFAQAVVLPTPAFRDKEWVSGTDIPLSLFLEHKTVPLLGGALPADLLARHPLAYDLLSDEGLALVGAALTAEGGIAAALSATKRGFYRTKAAVFGYGRIATFLVKALSGFGVPVTVYARRHEVRTRLALLGHRAKEWREADFIEEDLVFNTVPSAVFDKTVFAPNALVVDLGGGLAGYEAHPILSLPALPGKFAPVAAGEAMYEVLSAFFRKEGLH